MNQEKTLTYLAVPYSHDDPKIRQYRFEEVNKVAARLMAEGMHIFSPISHTHPLAEVGDLPRGWEFWRDYDTAILRQCKALIILKMDGWDTSKGVLGEQEIAESMGIPVTYMDHEPATATGLDPKGAVGKTKPQLHLLPMAGMVEQAKAHKCGADKYQPFNWRLVPVCQSTYISAMLRHIGEFQDGQDLDPESQAHHLGHVIANCAIILDARKFGTLVDDRVVAKTKNLDL